MLILLFYYSLSCTTFFSGKDGVFEAQLLVYVFTKNIKNRQMHPLLQKYVSILSNQVSLAQFHMDRAIFGSRLQTYTAVGGCAIGRIKFCAIWALYP